MNKHEEKVLTDIINNQYLSSKTVRIIQGLINTTKNHRKNPSNNIYVLQKKSYDESWYDITDSNDYSKVRQLLIELNKVAVNKYRIVKIYNRGIKRNEKN